MSGSLIERARALQTPPREVSQEELSRTRALFTGIYQQASNLIEQFGSASDASGWGKKLVSSIVQSGKPTVIVTLEKKRFRVSTEISIRVGALDEKLLIRKQHVPERVSGIEGDMTDHDEEFKGFPDEQTVLEYKRVLDLVETRVQDLPVR